MNRAMPTWAANQALDGLSPRKTLRETRMPYLQGHLSESEQRAFELNLLADPCLARSVELDGYFREGFIAWEDALRSRVPPISAIDDSLLAQVIACACEEARTQHTAHMHCCGVAVDAVAVGSHCVIALTHRDWHAEGRVFDIRSRKSPGQP